MNEPEAPANITEISPLQVPRLTTIPGRAMTVSRRPVTTNAFAKLIIWSSPWPYVGSMARSLVEHHESSFQLKNSNRPSFPHIALRPQRSRLVAFYYCACQM
ncbi:hypothetical protein HBH56_025970 [Parastagonospora nodorum]|uniref:Uncharacterized protein n=1 Tax=Phaeosphaeria nodorum (strain SN15 / ATCC MYA-4574 / FGSC 10173) TaxID=321614 RepID=A0A7U2F5V4_PHANO|nr:hypothetical protein HBH56_025970 [Parastagonospora nodorum]QRC98917.1 hypothetical protein JI435_412780 [Parastagonospora nodorum SN15]KAH3934610.1 hypothetical protein HBH54_056040 [Parastagonospora nodorum]KAH3976016.1 hypothetical protein HBH51_081620 [Parastagonospora nodorum]KAH3985185.1 hypothetical protein HBH52_054850 [Parastagonospora nodorum]